MLDVTIQKVGLVHHALIGQVIEVQNGHHQRCHSQEVGGAVCQNQRINLDSMIARMLVYSCNAHLPSDGGHAHRLW